MLPISRPKRCVGCNSTTHLTNCPSNKNYKDNSNISQFNKDNINHNKQVKPCSSCNGIDHKTKANKKCPSNEKYIEPVNKNTQNLKPCKCGSLTHQRISSEDCQLNKSNFNTAANRVIYSYFKGYFSKFIKKNIKILIIIR